jgi:ABC-type multidrug transport system fused ATPase/permease subunit
VFTSLSLFALLAEPLASLIMSLIPFVGSIGCFVRIQEFLDKNVRTDPRQMLLDSPDSSHQDCKTPVYSGRIDAAIDLSDSSGTPTVNPELSVPFKDVPFPCQRRNGIAVQGGIFGWDAEKEPLLKSVTLTVPGQKLTMLVGPVGCGKSTLLKALLGEVPSMGGLVQMSSLSVAYCDQTAWLMNDTIRQNIIVASDFDEKWYKSVIYACALERDFLQLPRGDRTVVGSKGVALSGGQIQRIVCPHLSL